MRLSELHSSICLADSGLIGVLGWGFVLIVMLFFAAAGVLRLRRWLKEDDVGETGPGFTLSDLRQLHREGKMTDEEFEKARGLMVAGAKALAAKLPDPLARKGDTLNPPRKSPGLGGRMPPGPPDEIEPQ